MLHRVLSRLSWLCLLMLGGILPVVFWNKTDDGRLVQWGTFWILSAVGLAAGWAVGLRARATGPLHVPLLAIAAAVLLLPLAAFRVPAALGRGLDLGACVATAILAAHWLRSQRRFLEFGVVLLVIHLGVSFYGFAQYLGIDPQRWMHQYGGQRPFATLGNPNILAGQFVVLLPWAAVMFLSARGRASKLLWFLVTMLWALLILVAQTRGAWIAAGVSMAWVGWQSRAVARNWLTAQWGQVAGLVALIAMVAIGASWQNPELAARVADLVPHDLGQVALRYTAARAALLTWRDRPVTGFGGSCFAHGFGKHMAAAMPSSERRLFTHTYAEADVHCDYLQLLAEYGVVGFGLLAWVVVCAVRLLLFRSRDDPLTRVLIGGGIALAIHGAFNFPLRIGPTAFLLWTGIGLAASMAPADPTAPVSGPVPKPKPAARLTVALAAVVVVLAVGTLASMKFAASAYSRMALAYRNAGDWRTSAVASEVGRRVDWDDRREAFYVASMRGQLGDYAGAAEMFAVEVRRNPYFMDGFTNYGAVLGFLGRKQEAEAQFRRAIELNPAYAEAYANLGIVLLELRRFPEAASVFQRALALEPAMRLARQGLGLAATHRRP